MKQVKLKGKNLKTSNALSASDLQKVMGGIYRPFASGGTDGCDCNSELASGGTTTDTYEPLTSTTSFA